MLFFICKRVKEINKQFNIKNLKIDKRMFNDVYFKHIEDYSHRYNIYYGGRNSGKTYAICDLLLLKGMKEKRRMLFMVKQSARIEESLWTLTLNELQKFNLLEYCIINKSTHTITLPKYETVIKMTGLDNESKGKLFFDASDIWLDEATDFLEQEVDTLDGTLRGKYKYPKQLFLSFNPVSRSSFVYKKYGFDTGIIPEDTFILKTTYKDNKWCDEATIKRLERLKEKNPARYKIEAEGDFATLDKLIFTYKTEKLDANELIRNNTELITCIGLDWGFNDPTTVILSLYDRDAQTLYIVDEIYQRGLTNAQIANLIKLKGWHKNIIYADCANPKDIVDLRNFGISKIKPCRKGKDSIMNGVRRLQEMDIIINESCENTITEFDNYCFEKSKLSGEYLDKPIDQWNHCIDSIRYSLQCIKNKPKIIKIRL